MTPSREAQHCNQTRPMDIVSSVTDVSGSSSVETILVVHTDKILGHGSGGATVYGEGVFGTIDVAVKQNVAGLL